MNSWFVRRHRIFMKKLLKVICDRIGTMLISICKPLRNVSFSEYVRIDERYSSI